MRRILYLLIIFTAYSCGKKHVYHEFQDVNVNNWASQDTLVYSVKIDASDKNFQYAISVRHQKDYEFSNLWLKMFIKGNGIDTSFRYEIPLFKADGKPFGKSSGSLCTQTVPLTTSLPLYSKGDYEIRIVQLMRKDPLPGIKDVGVILDIRK